MTILSKHSCSIPYNCYEVMHTWDPHCAKAAFSMGYSLFVEGLKLYGQMYLMSQAFQRKWSSKEFLRTILNASTSSLFLAANGGLYITTSCLLRKCLGKFYYPYSFYIPGLVASFIAILIERKSRRIPLTVYTVNLASETLFRMLVSRGMIQPIKNGEVYLFCAGMAAYLYLIRKRGFTRDISCIGLRYVIGSDEAGPLENSPSPKTLDRQPHFSGDELQASRRRSSFYERQGQFTLNMCKYVKHESCPHRMSCLKYALQGYFQAFAAGYIYYFLSKCLKSGSGILRKPILLLKFLMDSDTLRFGIFIGGFGGSFRVINCILRWAFGKDSELYAIPAAIFGGLFMKSLPSSTIALYFFWKAIETIYALGIEKSVLPEVKNGIPLLYAISGGLLLHAIALEPQNSKPAEKFMNKVTQKKIQQLNRRLMDVFGTQASKIYPDYLPDLDIKNTSKKLQENFLVWMIR